MMVNFRFWQKPVEAGLLSVVWPMHRSVAASRPHSLRSAQGWSGYRSSSYASSAQFHTPSASAAPPGRTR